MASTSHEGAKRVKKRKYSTSRCRPSCSAERICAASTPTARFAWEEYPEIDPWEPIWLPDFTRRHGLLLDTMDYKPLDYFNLFFPEAVSQLISDETNRYAEQFFESRDALAPRSRFSKWKPTTKDEMKGFVALQIEMGLDWRYNFREHWSTHTLSPGGFGQVMPHDRYVLLQSFIHFCDNKKQIPRGEPGYNPMYKVQPLLDIVEPTYKQFYQPGRDLSVDESMIKYKGRLFFRQYMPDKPTKYGIKDFVLAEANTGFCLKVITYTGKHSFQRENCPLTKLFMELQSRGIGACGTVRVNRRHMPLQLKPDRLKMKRGDNPVFMRADNLVALAWHDVKRVTCLTTVHTNNLCEKTICSKGNPEGRKLDKPVALEEYNCKMAGVDRLDQMLGSYAYGHKSTKWYHTVYHRMREIALTNGYIFFKQANSDSTMTAADFLKKVVDSLLAEYVGVPLAKRGRPAQTAVPDRLTERHFPATYEDKKYKPDCVLCSNRQLKKRHQCNTYCKQCNVAMHAIGCFERYHTLQDFAL
uniref:PiggyBac transposable element-derived protein domain-containing protein n=1 Tax=Erpetoichthys calabaricus TaxID=27687 RepID=A0A8C4S1I0_ERPCA